MRCRIVSKGSQYWCEEYKYSSGPASRPYHAWSKISYITWPSEAEANKELRQYMAPEIVVKEVVT